MKDLKGIRSDTSMLNSFLAVKVAAETRNDPEYKKKPEKAAENLAVIMGTMYEKAENSPSVNLDNVPDIKLTLTNDKESYQADAESLGEEGTFVFFVKPGRYKLTVDCSYYDHYETEVTAKAGDTECYALGLGREETKKRLLNEYADSLNTFYNDSYQYSGVLYRDDGNQRYEKTVEGFDAERKLGYAIDDFDDDGEYELLVLATDDNFNIIYEMYAVDGKEVSMVTREYATVDDNEHITLPASSSRGSEDCALISCFVEEQTHKIYLQISYNTSAFIDGNCTYITSIRYEDGDFCDLKGITVAGSSCEYGYPGYNLDLLEMGVSFPDIKKIFEEFAPLYEYFDGGIYEICHARQRTIITENDENGWLTSVQAITLFDSQESLYKRPIEKQTTKIISEERQHELYMPVIDEYNEKMEARGPIDTVSLYTYYCFADIDGNGVEELMVNYEPKRYRSGEYNTMEIMGGRLFSIFTLVNEQPALVYGIGLSSEGMNDGSATVYPNKSVICIGTTAGEFYNGRESYTYKYYVFKGDKMSDMPFLIENYKYNGKTYYPEVDGIKYGLDEFDKLFLDRLDTPSKHYEMILYTKDK